MPTSIAARQQHKHTLTTCRALGFCHGRETHGHVLARLAQSGADARARWMTPLTAAGNNSLRTSPRAGVDAQTIATACLGSAVAATRSHLERIVEAGAGARAMASLASTSDNPVEYNSACMIRECREKNVRANN